MSSKNSLEEQLHTGFSSPLGGLSLILKDFKWLNVDLAQWHWILLFFTAGKKKEWFYAEAL